MYTSGAIMFVNVVLWTILFCVIYRNLQIVKIKQTTFGMGDIIFGIISAFEFIQLISLLPSFIDDDSTKITKQLSIYLMAYLDVSDNIVNTQMYISYVIVFMTIFTSIILKIELPYYDIIFFARLFLTIVFGYILYIPGISMLMDIFMCKEEA